MNNRFLSIGLASAAYFLSPETACAVDSRDVARHCSIEADLNDPEITGALGGFRQKIEMASLLAGKKESSEEDIRLQWEAILAASRVLLDDEKIRNLEDALKSISRKKHGGLSPEDLKELVRIHSEVSEMKIILELLLEVLPFGKRRLSFEEPGAGEIGILATALVQQGFDDLSKRGLHCTNQYKEKIGSEAGRGLEHSTLQTDPQKEPSGTEKSVQNPSILLLETTDMLRWIKKTKQTGLRSYEVAIASQY